MSFQFTRYLYERQEVEYALCLSLLKKKESAKFWAFELYHSGFENELKQLLWKIFYDFYFISNNVFEKYLLNKFQKPLTPIEILRIITNLLTRPWTFDIFLIRIISSKFNYSDIKLSTFLEKKDIIAIGGLILKIKDDDSKIKNFRNALKLVILENKEENYLSEWKRFLLLKSKINISDNYFLMVKIVNILLKNHSKILGKNTYCHPPDTELIYYENHMVDLSLNGVGHKYPNLPKIASRKILSVACLESIDECELLSIFDLKRNNSNLKEAIYYNWEFYAYNSPIWKSRFNDHNAIIKNDKVEFESEDDFDQFYNHFGYEPDEQSQKIQNKILSINHTKTLYDFYKEEKKCILLFDDRKLKNITNILY